VHGLSKTGDGTSLVPLRMTFSMIGKFGITGSFGIVFLYTPEIFPTTLRYDQHTKHGCDQINCFVGF